MMEAGMAPASGIIKVVVVEDEPTDGDKIETALRDAGISKISYFTNYEEGNVVEAARDADIVSLDFEIAGETGDSLDVARAISRVNPYGGNFFYTREPQQVKNNPFNFLIEKNPTVGRVFSSISHMVMAHNRGLSILEALNELLHANNELEINERLTDIQGRLYRYYGLLASMTASFSRVDPSVSRRYGKLCSILLPDSQSPRDRLLGGQYIKAIRRPIIYSVRDDFERLRGIKGVHLKGELESNLESVIRGVSPVNLDYRLEEITRAYTLPEIDKEQIKVIEEQSEPVIILEEDEGRETLYLNAWFPEHLDKKSPLPCGLPVDLSVNIGPVPYALILTGEGSDEIAADKSHLFYSIESVDIMVMCPGARVDPVCQRLKMPPGPEATVTFRITPPRQGKFQLTVVILIHNDPIHRSAFSFEASGPEPVTQPLEAEERLGL